MVDESIQTTPSAKSNILEEKEVLPWTIDEEMAIDKANENIDEYVQEQARIEEQEEEVRRILEQDEQDEWHIEAKEIAIAVARQLSRFPSHSSYSFFNENILGVIFLDREAYLTTPVSYLMGLIEDTPNNKFTLELTQAKITRAIKVLQKKRSFVTHAQRSLQIREGTIIAQINTGERRLIKLNETVTYLNDTFHPTNNYYMPTTVMVSHFSSMASNSTPLCPMPGAYVSTLVNSHNNDVY